MNSIELGRHQQLCRELNAFYQRWVRAREMAMCRAMLEANSR
jgi:hypothetical protein